MIESMGTSSKNDQSNVADQMVTFTAWYIGVGVFQIVAGYIATAFLTISAERQASRIRRAYFRAMLRQEVGWYDTMSSGELTTRLTGLVFLLIMHPFLIKVKRC